MRGLQTHSWDATKPYWNVQTYFDLIQASGAQWIRVDAPNPFLAWSNARFNTFVSEAHKRNIKVLAILGRFTINENAAFTLADWQAAVTETARLWGVQVDAWEIWNEPNQPFEQIGYCNGTPEHYVELLKVAYNTLKTSKPVPPPILFAGLSPQMNSPDFYSAAWALGASAYCDVAAMHLYDVAFDYILSQIVAVVAPKPIWITESGVSSMTFGLEGQANALKNLDAYFKSKAADYKIENEFWYTFQDYDFEGQTTNYSSFMGLVTYDLKPKPSYAMFQSLAPPPPSPAPVSGGTAFFRSYLRAYGTWLLAWLDQLEKTKKEAA